jgi:pilus assembly protein FimV
MVRTFAGVVFAVSTLHASVVSALGLGEIELQSGLNQPLQAEIELNNLGELDPEQVAIKLGSPADFSRAGVERVYFLNDLKFVVQTDGKGGGVIKVSSSKLVREPYLDFVLEARWPDGRLLREYTVLVDMPVFTQSPAAVVAPAKSQQPASASAPVRARVPAPAPSAAALAPQPPQPRQALSGEVVTRKNDTLWGIAAKARPSGASMQQAMMAIYRNNPDAFTRQNINGLRTGQVLRMPTRDEYDALSRQQAIQAVAQQNDAWSQGSTAPLEASETSVVQAEEPVATGESYMKLSSGAGEATSPVGASAGTETVEVADEAIEDVRSELVVVQEKLDKTALENAELDSRLDDMEDQVETLAKLVELKDSQLAALQARLEQEASKASAPGSATATDQNFAAPAPTAAAAPGNGTAEEASLLDRLLSPLPLGALALLGLGLLALKRRKQTDEPAPEYAAAVPADRAVVIDTPAASEDTEELPETEQPFAKLSREDLRAKIAGEFDPLAEAEVYRSYDRNDEAIEMLQRAIDEHPERSELHLKLLSILEDLGRREAFISAYGRLEEEAGEDSLEAARKLAAKKGWLEPAEDAAENVSEEIDNADLDFDLDFDLEDADRTAEVVTKEQTELTSERQEGQGEVAESTPAEVEAAQVEKALDDLDFDLELDEGDADEVDNAELARMLDNAIEDDGDDLSEMVDGDEIATKLDLARAYVDMGDVDGARDILAEVLDSGTETQVREANELLRDLAS